MKSRLGRGRSDTLPRPRRGERASEQVTVQPLEASARPVARHPRGEYSQRGFPFSDEGNSPRRYRETNRERGAIMTRLRSWVRTATVRASDATAAWRCGSARKGKGLPKGKTVGFSLRRRSLRAFLAPWREMRKNDPLSTMPHPSSREFRTAVMSACLSTYI